jgi:hypothetical protein
MSHIGSLPRAIFDFEQCKESIGTAWAQFSMLLHTGPDLSLPDGMILCLFCLGLDIADLCLDMTIGGRFTHKTMMKQVEFLEHFIAKHAFSVMNPRTLQAIVMSSVGESSLGESNHIPSIDSTYEPPPKPRTPKD